MTDFVRQWDNAIENYSGYLNEIAEQLAAVQLPNGKHFEVTAEVQEGIDVVFLQDVNPDFQPLEGLAISYLFQILKNVANKGGIDYYDLWDSVSSRIGYYERGYAEPVGFVVMRG